MNIIIVQLVVLFIFEQRGCQGESNEAFIFCSFGRGYEDWGMSWGWRNTRNKNTFLTPSRYYIRNKSNNFSSVYTCVYTCV